MNKTELISKVAGKTGETKKDSKIVVDAVFETIQEELASHNDVSILGFGSFKVKERAARKGRNPADGTEIDIPARKAVTFTVGKELKNAVKES